MNLIKCNNIILENQFIPDTGAKKSNGHLLFKALKVLRGFYCDFIHFYLLQFLSS